jgi:hypothetical protein
MERIAAGEIKLRRGREVQRPQARTVRLSCSQTSACTIKLEAGQMLAMLRQARERLPAHALAAGTLHVYPGGGEL